MAKEIEGTLKLQVPAGQANPSPPVGPALGQRGINIMDFCKMFNDKSKNEQPGVMLPVVVTYFTDKSFTMDIKLPPASFFIKEASLIKNDAGGSFISIVKLLSVKYVTTTGSITPGCSFLLLSLNILQKSIILIPLWPRAGPTGGEGFACPAGTCNFNVPSISFAIMLSLLVYTLIQQVLICQI